MLCYSCVNDTILPSSQLFSSLDSDSGIHFSNDLTINDSMNFFTYGYFYMGGGVAVGDFNQDNQPDLFFSGNMVSNHMYLNEGELKFKEVGHQAGISGDGQWMTGVTMVDINNDGKDDIYVSVAGKWKDRKNILYVNQGLDEDGIPQFVNKAEEYGIADAGYTIQSVFFDYDKDGDLDLYVGNYEPTPFNYITNQYIQKTKTYSEAASDHLYRNNGDGSFTDVSKEAGVQQFGLTIGLIANDFNNDGWTDLYVSNDFHSADRFFINNGDGSFTNVLDEAIQHTSFYGMGIDATDYNHDGLLDMFQLDMAAADNYRSKANMASMDVQGFRNMVNGGLGYQYMYNSLQTCQGIKEDGIPFYAETAKMSSLDKTDWSWACLFGDYDNDGYKDLFISNGTRRDINNKDYFNWLERVDVSLKIKYKQLDVIELTKRMPSQKIDNFVFKNKDGERFEKYNKEWGLHFEGYSNGAAYADLDRDGDLELIINNIDSTAQIFKNHAIEQGNRSVVQVALKGPEQNIHGIGAKVELKGEQVSILHEQALVRGFQSSVDPLLHFGIPDTEEIKEVVVTWPDGKKERQILPEGQSLLEFQYINASIEKETLLAEAKTLFNEENIKTLQSYVHIENPYDDFKREVLLPHKMSQMGPAFAHYDLDGDGLQDYYIGGAQGYAGQLLLSKLNDFVSFPDSFHEDSYATFIDVDNDGDMDLYVASGGNEKQHKDGYYRDRLYINKNLKFEEDFAALPDQFISSGKVLVLDYNKDGKQDILVTGRQVPGSYPNPATSLLLKNSSEGTLISFEDVTKEVAPDLINLGMVTDALWQDLNNDQEPDLLLVGEWMNITLFEFNDKQFVKKEIKDSRGWWNTCEAGDFDGDGDIDVVLGNLGNNYKYKVDEENRFRIYATDFDENGKQDVVLSYEEKGQEFPVRGKQCSSEQIPDLKKRFTTYDAFAKAELSEIYRVDKLKESTQYSIDLFENAYLENVGNMDFTLRSLPLECQTSSINDFAVLDIDSDGDLDLVAGGNLFEAEVETPRNDASYGLVLKNDGTGTFKLMHFSETGIYVPHETRHVQLIEENDQKYIYFVTNEGPIQVYSK